MGTASLGVVPAADLLSELLVVAGAVNASATTWAQVRLLEHEFDHPTLGVDLKAVTPDPDERQRAARFERLARTARRHWRVFDRSLLYPLQTLSHQEDRTSPVEAVRLHLVATGLFVALAGCGTGAIDLSLEDLWLHTWKLAIRHAEGFLRDEGGDARVVPLREAEAAVSQAPSALDDLTMADAAAEDSRRLSALLAVAAPRERELLLLMQGNSTLSLEEAAACMGVKGSTARVLMHRLRRRAAGV